MPAAASAEISAPLEQVPSVAVKLVLGAAGFVLLLTRLARHTAACSHLSSCSPTCQHTHRPKNAGRAGFACTSVVASSNCDIELSGGVVASYSSTADMQHFPGVPDAGWMRLTRRPLLETGVSKHVFR